jgi:putative MFS transporter
MTNTSPDQELRPAVIGAAIDRSRLTPRLIGIMGLTGSGLLFDLFDMSAISYALPAIQTEFGLNAGQLGQIVAAGGLGAFLGTFCWGFIADRWGRRLVFALTLLVFTLFTGFQALAVSAVTLMLVRFLAGIGSGGAQPVDQVLLTEFSPARLRGRISGSAQWAGTIGVLLAAGLGLLLVPTVGWRWLFVAALPGLALLAFVWRVIPESPRWLVSKGRHAEARKSLNALGITDQELAEVAAQVPPDTPGAARPTAKVRDLFKGRAGISTAQLWLCLFGATFAAYGVQSFLPTIFANVYGIPLGETLRFTLILAAMSVVNRFIAIFAMDRIGRKPVVVIGFIGGAIAVSLFVIAQTPDKRALLMGAALALQFCLDHVVTTLFVWTTEVYPVSIRALGASWASAFGKLGAILAPLIVGALVGADNVTGVWVLVGIVLAVSGLLSLVLGKETKGRSLDEISAKPAA